MHDRLRAWHVLFAGPVVEFLGGLAMLLGSPLAQDAGLGNETAVALALHGSVAVVVAVAGGVAAIVPLVLLAFGRLRRLGAVLSALLSVAFGVLPPEPHPATWGLVGAFAFAAFLGWREAERARVERARVERAQTEQATAVEDADVEDADADEDLVADG